MYTPVSSFPFGTNPRSILPEAPQMCEYVLRVSIRIMGVHGVSLFEVVPTIPFEEDMCIGLVSEQ